MSQSPTTSVLSGGGMPYSDAPSLTRKSGSLLTSDNVMTFLVRGSAVMILVMMGALVAVLVYAAAPSVKMYGAKFLVSSTWRANELPVY
jgi:ABC-type phosphate transport system permease subunit